MPDVYYKVNKDLKSSSFSLGVSSPIKSKNLIQFRLDVKFDSLWHNHTVLIICQSS